MANFGWSLPPGCGVTPGEEPLPECCEACPEELHTNCPGEDACEIFQKFVADAAKVDEQMYADCSTADQVAVVGGYTSPYARGLH